mgnify:CR=1 FL=1
MLFRSLDEARTKWNAIDNKYSTQDEYDAALKRKGELIDAMTKEIARIGPAAGLSPEQQTAYINSMVNTLQEPTYVEPKPDYEGARLALEKEKFEWGKTHKGGGSYEGGQSQWYNHLNSDNSALAQSAANYLIGGKYQGEEIIDSKITVGVGSGKTINYSTPKTLTINTRYYDPKLGYRGKTYYIPLSDLSLAKSSSLYFSSEKQKSAGYEDLPSEMGGDYESQPAEDNIKGYTTDGMPVF